MSLHCKYFRKKNHYKVRVEVYIARPRRQWQPGTRFNIKMISYQYRKSHCGDKTILRPSYLHNGISYTGKMTSLYWIRAQLFQQSVQRGVWVVEKESAHANMNEVNEVEKCTKFTGKNISTNLYLPDSSKFRLFETDCKEFRIKHCQNLLADGHFNFPWAVGHRICRASA